MKSITVGIVRLQEMYNIIMLKVLRKHLPLAILLIGIFFYCLYFSLFTINRFDKLQAHYFDLGIMDQTVHNTYMGIKTFDLSRILELTDPAAGTSQVKRMAVHNDIILAFLAPFYFIHDGSATLLVMQTFVLALGAYYVFLIGKNIFNKHKFRDWIALIFAYGYLLYPPLQKANNFDFHAVTFATTLLLMMFYYFSQKKYRLSILLAFLAAMTKEQVGLTVASFGGYVILNEFIVNYFNKKDKLLKKLKEKKILFAIILVVMGLVWVLLSMKVIIPFSRSGPHFGAEYYEYLKTDPLKGLHALFRYESAKYLSIILTPFGFLSLLAPLRFLIMIPELLVILLSTNSNMRNIYFHYESVLTPFIVITSMYGGRNFLNANLIEKLKRLVPKKFRHYIFFSTSFFLIIYVILSALSASMYMSPLPWGHHSDLYPWQKADIKLQDVRLWKSYLRDDSVAVSTTGHLAPHFTDRRYFYNFAGGYDKASYVIIDTYELGRGFQGREKKEEYDKLVRDWRYVNIYKQHGIEVYKNVY